MENKDLIGLSISSAVNILKNKNLDKQKIIHMISNLKNKIGSTDELKIGDVVRIPCFTMHPIVIFNICEDKCHGLVVTSTKDCGTTFYETNSRFVKGYFTNALIEITVDKAVKGFTSVYDNPRHLNKVMKKYKENILDLFSK